MPNSLKAAASRYGKPLEQLIPELLASEGTIYGVAVKLGVYPNSVRHWMVAHGVRIETRRVIIRDEDEGAQQ